MTPVTFGSVASGIEAASVAFKPLGWESVWLAEIDANPSSILKHHYPDTPNLGDMTKIPQLLRNGDIPAPDNFCGGTPCQAFSVAGSRNSLDDARGNLSLTFCDIANEIDIQRAANGLLPCVIEWENVPGVLSTKDNAFGCFLGQLAGEDEALIPEPCPAAGKSSRWWRWDKKTGQHAPSWPDAGAVLGPKRAIAWRVLDAQYFGLAQRRRRVLVVASAREGFDPVAVLFESEGVRRDSAPSRSTQEDIAGTITASAARRGGVQDECGIGLQPVAFGHGGNCAETETARAITAHPSGFRLDFETETFLVQAAPIAFDARQDCVSSTEVFGALGSSSPQAQAICIHSDAIGRTGEAITPSADAAGNVRLRNPGMGIINDGTVYNLMATGQPHAVCVTGDITHTLKAEGFDASEDGAGRGQPIVTATQPIGLTGEINASTDLIGALDAGSRSGGGQPSMVYQGGMAVRRLMPIECERLQGFPDGYTAIPLPGRRKEDGGARIMADGPRYKALGNSWAVPKFAWLGARIDKRLRELMAKAA
jgi:DNA (cytosine-5)-methyltransferase 1